MCKKSLKILRKSEIERGQTTQRYIKDKQPNNGQPKTTEKTKD